jgi:hypothetical protein
MTESIIFVLPEEVRPELTEKFVVPVNADGSLHLDIIRFRAYEGLPPDPAYLAIYGDRYNGLPGLFNIFSDNTQSDVWLRFTWLNPEINTFAATGAFEIISLVYAEWVTDVYWSGTPSFWGEAGGICVGLANGSGKSWEAGSNLSGGTGSAIGGNSIGTNPVVDLHVTRTGLNGFNGGDWDNEVWVDGILRWSGSTSEGAPSLHPIGRTGIGAVSVLTQYGNYNTSIIPITDIMVGTTQGGSDLMATANFENDSYLPFDDSQDGEPPSFDIFTY